MEDRHQDFFHTIAYGLDKDNVFMKDIADPGLKDKMFKVMFFILLSMSSALTPTIS